MTKKSEKYRLQFIKLLADMKDVNNNQRRQNKCLFSLGLREGFKNKYEVLIDAYMQRKRHTERKRRRYRDRMRQR